MKYIPGRSGVSVVELLIALSILGLISAFVIPQILQTQVDARRKAIFKETIAALNQAMTEGQQSGELTEGNFGTYMMDHLNAIKKCPTDSQAEGCWDTSSNPTSQANQMGVVLANGAFVSGLDNTVGATGYETVLVDWNGLDGPNREGGSVADSDEIILRAIIDTTSTTDRVGTVRYDAGYPTSKNLWLEIFN